MIKKILYVALLLIIPLIINSCSAQTMINTKLAAAKKGFVQIQVYRKACTEMVCLEGMHSVGSGALMLLKGKPYALTAAHVCEPEAGDLEPDSGVEVKILLQDINGVKHQAQLVKYNRDLDLCLVSVQENTNVANRFFYFKLSSEAPTYAQKVYNISAPLGVVDIQMLPLFEGRFFGSVKDRDMYSMPAAIGASGSPIINNKGEIVGVVLAVHRNFHHITLSTRFWDIHGFFRPLYN